MRNIFILTVLVIGLSASSVHANPAERTRGLAKSMKAIVSAPEGGDLTVEQKASNCKLYTEIDAYFDYDAIIDTAISSIEKMTPKQREEFKTKFRGLVRMIAYPDSGKFFRSAKSTYGEAKIEGATATVVMDSSIEKEDFRNTVRYTWKNDGDTWRITDIAFDGASLVKDYQNQFKRIADKEGVDGLLKRLNDKYEEEKAKRLVCGR